MLKRAAGITAVLVTLVLLLAGCGGSSKNSVSPYAFLGLQDIPQCDYLDTYSTYHYIQTYDAYAMSLKTEETEAKDGADSYKENPSTVTYTKDGRVLSLSKNSKVYVETNLGSTAKTDEIIDAARESGENIIGREFTGTGSDKIPQYCDEGDDAAYDYYEYDYPNSESEVGAKITERFYMKDGDVFAIYQKTEWGESVIEYTQVIKSISDDVPEGIFEIPDLSDYKQY